MKKQDRLDAYVSKPIRSEQLFDTIDRFATTVDQATATLSDNNSRTIDRSASIAQLEMMGNNGDLTGARETLEA